MTYKTYRSSFSDKTHLCWVCPAFTCISGFTAPQLLGVCSVFTATKVSLVNEVTFAPHPRWGAWWPLGANPVVRELTVPLSPSLIWGLGGGLEVDPVSRDQWSVGASNDASTNAQGTAGQLVIAFQGLPCWGARGLRGHGRPPSSLRTEADGFKMLPSASLHQTADSQPEMSFGTNR